MVLTSDRFAALVEAQQHPASPLFTGRTRQAGSHEEAAAVAAGMRDVIGFFQENYQRLLDLDDPFFHDLEHKCLGTVFQRCQNRAGKRQGQENVGDPV